MNTQQTPQSQSTMNSTGQASVNVNPANAKMAGQQVYPLKQGKIRQHNPPNVVGNAELGQAPPGVVNQANFNS